MCVQSNLLQCWLGLPLKAVGGASRGASSTDQYVHVDLILVINLVRYLKVHVDLLNLVQLYMYEYVYNSWCFTKITCTLLAHVHVLVRTAVDLINLLPSGTVLESRSTCKFTCTIQPYLVLSSTLLNLIHVYFLQTILIKIRPFQKIKLGKHYE